MTISLIKIIFVTDGKEFSGKMEEHDKKPTKDDAYSQFMREMEDLL